MSDPITEFFEWLFGGLADLLGLPDPSKPTSGAPLALPPSLAEKATVTAAGITAAKLTATPTEIIFAPDLINTMKGIRAENPGWLLQLINFRAAWEGKCGEWHLHRYKYSWLDKANWDNHEYESWGVAHVEPAGFCIGNGLNWWDASNGFALGAPPAVLPLRRLVDGHYPGGTYPAGKYSYDNDDWNGLLGLPIATLLPLAISRAGRLQWPPRRSTGGVYSSAGAMTDSEYLERARDYYAVGTALVLAVEQYRLAKGEKLYESKSFDLEWTKYALQWGVPVATNKRLDSKKRFRMAGSAGGEIWPNLPEIVIPWRTMAQCVMEVAPLPGTITSGWEVGGDGTPFQKRPLLDWPKAEEWGVLRPYTDVARFDGLSLGQVAQDLGQAKDYARGERVKGIFSTISSVLSSVVTAPLSPLVKLAYSVASMFIQYMAEGGNRAELVGAVKRLAVLASQTAMEELRVTELEAIRAFSDKMDTMRDTYGWDHLGDYFGNVVDKVQGGDATEQKIADALTELLPD